jgi:acetate kinase
LGAVLVVNAGSTSLKLSLVASDGSATQVESLEASPADLDAVAHRIVHGGLRFRDPVVIDKEVERELDALTELAPLHNGPALIALEEARRTLPDVPHVAVFDTAFHATLPDEAATYAVPKSWRDEWHVRRYGFHGLSVQWAAEQVPVERLIVCHLGGGCSVSAVRDGRSVDTTMGFSPLEGVPMATRSGSVDPEIVLHLMRKRNLGLDDVEWALGHESGLLGLSGSTSRVDLLERSDSADAKLALSVWVHRVAGAVGAMAASLGGIDALVFTAGIGENSAEMRRRICARLGFLGLELDDEANRDAEPDAEIAAAGSAVRIVVLRAREDIVAARAARSLLASAS